MKKTHYQKQKPEKSTKRNKIFLVDDDTMQDVLIRDYVSKKEFTFDIVYMKSWLDVINAEINKGDIVILDYLFSTGITSIIVFEYLEELGAKVLIHTCVDESRITSDLKYHNKKLPKNSEYFRKNGFKVIDRVAELFNSY